MPETPEPGVDALTALFDEAVSNALILRVRTCTGDTHVGTAHWREECTWVLRRLDNRRRIRLNPAEVEVSGIDVVGVAVRDYEFGYTS